MNVHIKTVPHSSQLYDTVGDYRTTEEGTLITVSDMGNEDYAFLVAVHELIEAHFTKFAGIKEKDITDFDEEYERNRPEGDDSEPGDSPDAPYKQEHFFATSIERILAQALEVDWDDYEKTLNSL